MRLLAFAGGFWLLTVSHAAAAICTLLVDAGGKVLHESGACDARISPASTFKVPLAVMGFEAGILHNPHAPVWPYREKYRAARAQWKRPVDPAYWLKESVVWFSQQLTQQLGMLEFQRYVDVFGYGNRDLSGDPGQKNGLTQAWLGYSSLQVSPREQTIFLRRLLNRALPVSRAAQEQTIAAMPVFAADGWVVHGKTGSGFQRAGNGVNTSQRFGWFIGWAEKPGRQAVVFARLTMPNDGKAVAAGPPTRDGLLADLPGLLAQN